MIVFISRGYCKLTIKKYQLAIAFLIKKHLPHLSKEKKDTYFLEKNEKISGRSIEVRNEAIKNEKK